MSCTSTKVQNNRNKIFSLINHIENYPIDPNDDYVKYSRELMDYCIKGNSFVYVDQDTLSPWLQKFKDDQTKSKWLSLLFGSYLAGCIKSYDKDRSYINTAYNGNMNTYHMYKRIKQIDSTLNIPYLDSLDNHSFQIDMKKRCDEFLYNKYQNEKK
jgi:hypothetical protein